MTAKGKKRLKTALLALGILLLLIGAVYGGILMRDAIYSNNYAKILNDAGIYSAGQDAEEPHAQTELAAKITEHFSSALPEGKNVKKALIIGLDGTRADAIVNAKEGISGILELKAQGGLYPVYCGGDEGALQDTSTAPGWATLLTGSWALEDGGHGVTGNSKPKGVEPKTILTSLAEDNKISSADFIVSWNGHLVNRRATYAQEAAYTKEQSLPINWQTTAGDDETFSAAKEKLEAGDDLVFLIFEYCDHTGHTSSFGNDNPLYREAFLTADKQAKRLIDAVKARPSYESEDWLIIMTTDHGGTGLSHGGQTDTQRLIWVASNKPLW
ncbi:MAG: alkaline phosphatase family protein [Clostridium sp.]|jgi:predicted AlkP superfamily pyrophosphatase or phosphodiesterase|nr:alkaline phosphatase family protein [Clostridium sp.]